MKKEEKIITNQQAFDDLALIRAMATEGKWRELSSIIYAVNPIICPEAGTMAVDEHWNLYFNPRFLRELIESGNHAHAVWGLVHESMHLMLEHFRRFRERYGTDDSLRKKANIAQDMAINQMASETELADWMLHPSRYNLPLNLAWEEYMDKIPQELLDKVHGGFKRSRTQQPCDHDGHDDSCHVGGGQCGVDRKREWMNGPKASPGAVERAVREAARRIKEAVRRPKESGIGNIPAWLQEWADFFADVPPPKVDWRRELRVQIGHGLATVLGDKTMVRRRLSRRSQSTWPILWPSRCSQEPRLAVIVDTSGSVSDDEVLAFIGEVVGVARSVGCSDFPVYVGDVTIAATYRASQVLKGEFARTDGGTNMEQCVVQAVQTCPSPQVVVVLTDGETIWSENPPPEIPAGVRVVVCVSRDTSTTPDWVHRVVLPDAFSSE